MTPIHHDGDVHAFHSAVDADGKVVDVPAHTHTQNQDGRTPSPIPFALESEDKKTFRYEQLYTHYTL